MKKQLFIVRGLFSLTRYNGGAQIDCRRDGFRDDVEVPLPEYQ